MSKSISVSNNVHRKLYDKKLDMNMKTIEDVINFLFDTIEQLDKVIDIFRKYFKYFPKEIKSKLKEELKNKVK